MTKITKAEMELMRIIWATAEPVTSGGLLERLPAGNEWKPTTVLTFLSRLAEKGLLTVEKRGKTNLYAAAVTEEAYRAQETACFLEDVHGGSVKSLIAALYDADGLTPTELDELRSWLARR